MTEPEFARRVALAEASSRALSIEANEGERVALAKRFALTSLDKLEANAELHVRAAGVEARGQLHALVTQSCIASGAPVKQKIEEPFLILFTPPGIASGEEVELSADDCDQMEHDGQAIDLGEAVAQTLALALDPFPRAADADEVLAKAGVVPEGEEAIGPFAALKGLIG